MYLRFTSFLFLIASLSAGATVFQRHSINQQIDEADGIMIGHYLKSKVIRLEDGAVATQMIFKMNKETGLNSDLLGQDEVIVHYPGGKLDDVTVKVEGVPRFIPGESVVVMIKNSSDRYWGMNLGFGTFKVVNYGNEKMIVNTLFPNDRKVGQVKLEEFEKNVRRIKAQGLKIVHRSYYPTELDLNQRSPASVEEDLSAGKNRSLASSTEEGENQSAPSGFNSAWLVFILAMLGGIFRFQTAKRN